MLSSPIENQDFASCIVAVLAGEEPNTFGQGDLHLRVGECWPERGPGLLWVFKHHDSPW